MDQSVDADLMWRIFSCVSRGSSRGVSGESLETLRKSSNSMVSPRPVYDSRPAKDDGSPASRWHWDNMCSCIIIRIGSAAPYTAACSLRRVNFSFANASRSIFSTGCSVAVEYLTVSSGTFTSGCKLTVFFLLSIMNSISRSVGYRKLKGTITSLWSAEQRQSKRNWTESLFCVEDDVGMADFQLLDYLVYINANWLQHTPVLESAFRDLCGLMLILYNPGKNFITWPSLLPLRSM